MFLAVLLGSCTPHVIVKEHYTNAADVLRRVVERNASVQTLSGKGSISIKSPEISISGGFYVSMKRPDSLLLILRGPFGFHVGTLSLTKTSFEYYNSLQDNVLEGTPDSSTLLAVLHVGMPVEQIFDTFAGAFTMIQDSLIRFASTDDEYLMAFSHEGKTLEYTVDAASFVVTDYLVKDHDDKVLFEAEMSHITSDKNPSMPQTLEISFPGSQRSVTLTYNDVSLNEDVSCFLTIPEGTKVIRR